MKNLVMCTAVVLYYFGVWIGYFVLMLIIFIPVIPIVLVAFPMMILDPTHWSCKPYRWYFDNIWLRVIKVKG